MSYELKNAGDRIISPTIQKMLDYAAYIMSNGGPKDKNEREVMKIWSSYTGGKAGNAGKRKIQKTGK